MKLTKRFAPPALLVLLFVGGLSWMNLAEKLFSSHCPRCNRPFAAEPVSDVTTNENVLNGVLTRHRLLLKCPYCGYQFKARAENLEREEIAIELPALSAKIEQPPIPPPVPVVLQTNLVLMTAPVGYRFRTVTGSNLSLQEVINQHQTNKANLLLIILEPCQPNSK